MGVKIKLIGLDLHHHFTFRVQTLGLGTWHTTALLDLNLLQHHFVITGFIVVSITGVILQHDKNSNYSLKVTAMQHQMLRKPCICSLAGYYQIEPLPRQFWFLLTWLPIESSGLKYELNDLLPCCQELSVSLDDDVVLRKRNRWEYKINFDVHDRYTI